MEPPIGLRPPIAAAAGGLERTKARIIATVHDEIVLEAPETHAQEVAARLQTVMKQAGQTYVTCVPIEVEVAIASNWIKQ